MYHPCDACGGSGGYCATVLDYMDGFVTDCPVCLGAGRFSDRMPVADALADAETLRQMSIPGQAPLKVGARLSGEAYRIIYAGGVSIQYLAAEGAKHDAHIAFRAVPGLRED